MLVGRIVRYPRTRMRELYTAGGSEFGLTTFGLATLS
jgi:hypothetical protein